MIIKRIYNIPRYISVIHVLIQTLKYCGYKSSDYTRGQFLNVANEEVFDDVSLTHIKPYRFLDEFQVISA